MIKPIDNSGGQRALDGTELNVLTTSVGRFIDQHIEPFWQQWAEQGSISREYYCQLGKAGYLGTDLPVEHGGSDAGFYFLAELMKIFCRAGHFAHGGLLLAQHYVVAHLLNNDQATAEQKEQFLEPLITGDIIPALAISESQGGSDLRGTRSHAVSDGAGYVLNGNKTFVSNASIADFFVVLASTNTENGKALTAFLVRSDMPGVEVGRALKKTGMQTGNTAELFLCDVRVSAVNVLGPLGGGISLLKAGMPRERIYAGICATALCETALQWTIDYVKERVLFGKPLSSMQNTRFLLAGLHAEWQIFDAFIDQLITEMAASTLSTEKAAVARLKGAELCTKVVNGCTQLFGGYGFMDEYAIARLASDVRGMGFWGGCNEVMLDVIGRPLLRI